MSVLDATLRRRALISLFAVTVACDDPPPPAPPPPVEPYFAQLEDLTSEVVGFATAELNKGRPEGPLGTFAAPDFEDGTSVIVCVRQGGIRLLEAGQGTPGRVLDSRFLGDVGLLEIAVDGVAGLPGMNANAATVLH